MLAVAYLAGYAPRHRVEAASYIAAALLGLAVVVQSRASKPDREATARAPGALSTVLLGLLIISFAFFHRSLNIGLLSDDFALLDRARQGVLTIGNELFRPGPQFIWLVTEHTPGLGPWFLHALNILLHGVNAWLVFVLATHVGLQSAWALCAAGLFLLHPACVETVVWVSALFDLGLVSGSLLFVIGCLRASWAAALAGLAVALLSKETAIVTPILGILVTLARGGSLRIPLWGAFITAVFMSVRLWALPPPETHWIEPSRYVLKELTTRVFGSLAVPWTSGNAALVWSTLGALSLALIFILGAQRSMMIETLARLLAFVAWVVIAVIPLYGIFFVAPTLEGGRYLYLSSVGWSILLMTLASHASNTLPSARTAVVIATGLLLAVCAIGVIRHQRPWLEAAALRDQVLQSARDAASTQGCASIDVKNPPDSVEGAYVFRNGIREALARANISSTRDETPIHCVFEWSGTTLIATESR